MRNEYLITGLVFALVGAVITAYATVEMVLPIQIQGAIFVIVGVTLLIIGGTIPDKKEIPKSPPIQKTYPVSQDEAQNILRTRYAKGEITKEEFEQMKKDLDK